MSAVGSFEYGPETFSRGPFVLCSIVSAEVAVILAAPPSGTFFPVEKTKEFVFDFYSFREDRRLLAMNCDEGQLLFVDAQFCGSHNTILRAWYNIWGDFSWKHTHPASTKVTLLDICSIWWPKKASLAANLSDLAHAMRTSSPPSDDIEDVTILGRLYQKVPNLQELSKWERDCDFEAHMGLAC